MEMGTGEWDAGAWEWIDSRMLNDFHVVSVLRLEYNDGATRGSWDVIADEVIYQGYVQRGPCFD